MMKFLVVEAQLKTANGDNVDVIFLTNGVSMNTKKI